MAEFNERDGKNFDSRTSKPKNDAPFKNDWKGNFAPSECTPVPDNEAPRGKKAKRIVATITSVAALTLLGTSILGSGPTDIDVDITSLWANETQIGYHVVVPMNENLTMVVYNEFLRHEVRLNGGDNEGIVDGLKSGRTYTVEVQSSGAVSNGTVFKRKIRTKDAD